MFLLQRDYIKDHWFILGVFWAGTISIAVFSNGILQ